MFWYLICSWNKSNIKIFELENIWMNDHGSLSQSQKEGGILENK